VVAAKAGLVLGVAALLTGCSAGGSSHPSPAPAVSTSAKPTASASADPLTSWARGGGLDKIDAVTTDIAAIQQAGSNASMVRDACAELEASAAAGQFYRPIPQKEAQQHWAAALADFKTAAGECLAAIDENKPSLLQKTSADLDQGTTELAATTKTLRLN
jgi:hypothetical protein